MQSDLSGRTVRISSLPIARFIGLTGIPRRPALALLAVDGNHLLFQTVLPKGRVAAGQ